MENLSTQEKRFLKGLRQAVNGEQSPQAAKDVAAIFSCKTDKMGSTLFLKLVPSMENKMKNKAFNNYMHAFQHFMEIKDLTYYNAISTLKFTSLK